MHSEHVKEILCSGGCQARDLHNAAPQYLIGSHTLDDLCIFLGIEEYNVESKYMILDVAVKSQFVVVRVEVDAASSTLFVPKPRLNAEE